MHFSCLITPQGPLLPVIFQCTHGYRGALIAAGKPVPNPHSLNLLIDTGASSTVVDTSLIGLMGLPQRGSISVLTPTTGAVAVPTPQYDVDLIIPSPTGPPYIVPNLLVMACDLSAQGIGGLIGRDVLSKARMTYCGPEGHMFLSF